MYSLQLSLYLYSLSKWHYPIWRGESKRYGRIVWIKCKMTDHDGEVTWFVYVPPCSTCSCTLRCSAISITSLSWFEYDCQTPSPFSKNQCVGRMTEEVAPKFFTKIDRDRIWVSVSVYDWVLSSTGWCEEAEQNRDYEQFWFLFGKTFSQKEKKSSQKKSQKDFFPLVSFWHMMRVHLRVSQASVFIIVLSWHLNPPALAFFYSATREDFLKGVLSLEDELLQSRSLQRECRTVYVMDTF
jgi:hypothetical protein